MKSSQQTLFGFIADGFRNLLDLDKGLPGTIKQMFIDPKPVIDSYWNKLEAYFAPIKYIIITGIIYAVFWEFMVGQEFASVIAKDFVSGFNAVESTSQDTIVVKEGITEQIFVSMNRYMAYVTIALLPLMAAFTFLLFYKERQSFLQHLILNAYIAGQTILIAIIPMFAALVSYNVYNLSIWFFWVFGFSYYIWATLKYFPNKSLLFRIGYILAYMIFSIIYIVITMLVFVFIVKHFSAVAG